MFHVTRSQAVVVNAKRVAVYHVKGEGASEAAWWLIVGAPTRRLFC